MSPKQEPLGSGFVILSELASGVIAAASTFVLKSI